jgi:muconolactone D-isomerase
MEFLVDMVTTVPDGTTDAEVDAIRAREAARSRELAAQRHLLRLWRPPLDAGEWRTWGLFQAADATELESVLSSMPLRVWRHDTVTPLTAHPSDPDSGGVMSNQTSTAEADMLDAVLTRWKAAVDAHQPEHVAALFNGRDLSRPASLHRGASGRRRVLRHPANGHDRGIHAPRDARAQRWSGARLPDCRLRFQRPRHPHRVPQCDHPPGRRRLADRPLPGVAPRLRSQR